VQAGSPRASSNGAQTEMLLARLLVRTAARDRQPSAHDLPDARLARYEPLTAYSQQCADVLSRVPSMSVLDLVLGLLQFAGGCEVVWRLLVIRPADIDK